MTNELRQRCANASATTPHHVTARHHTSPHAPRSRHTALTLPPPVARCPVQELDTAPRSGAKAKAVRVGSDSDSDSDSDSEDAPLRTLVPARSSSGRKASAQAKYTFSDSDAGEDSD